MGAGWQRWWSDGGAAERAAYADAHDLKPIDPTLYVFPEGTTREYALSVLSEAMSIAELRAAGIYR